jgi:Rad3-related DNA helicase
MVDFLKYFDGTSRVPRPVQKDVLEWFAENWKHPILAGNFPVALGKSALAQAISLVTGAHVITPSNLLIDQYAASYPKKNFLKGKTHYNCSSGYSCHDWTNTLEQKACQDCPYTVCKQRALTQPTFFNPMSLYYLTQAEGWEDPNVLIVDEAHTLPSMLLLLCGSRLRYSMFKFPETVTNTVFLGRWLQDQIKKLSALAIYYKAQPTRFAEITRELEQIRMTLRGLEEAPENYAVWIDSGKYRGRPDRYLNIKPIRPPRFVVDKLLRAKKLILMSGTLMQSDILDLVGDRHVKFLDAPSPIPKENRPVYFKPAPFRMNWEADPRKIVGEIEKILAANLGLNTLVHTTYSMSKKLAPHFSGPVIVNDSTNKIEKLDFFKQHGGVFLASGCAEGIDLKGDLCRLNIIPKLPFPDLKDPIVAKRKALQDGDDWYALETLKVVIQACGRSTRDPDDFSKTYILDGNFSRLIRQYKDKLPKSFVESIVWAES